MCRQPSLALNDVHVAVVLWIIDGIGSPHSIWCDGEPETSRPDGPSTQPLVNATWPSVTLTFGAEGAIALVDIVYSQPSVIFFEATCKRSPK